ncbi:tRNA pseudouridine synthase Pus10 [Atheta coriaria]|uniref:tRNA pseudouridine synthase Pus10 n=1 Tax=Dalotia coriaria TaxID=877792 RepID=UPI0031F37722
MTTAEEKQIVSYLLDLGCCLNCSIRYLCDKQLEFSELDDFLSQKLIINEVEIKEEDQIKRVKNNACIVCLGLLQDHMLQEILNCPDLQKTQNYDNPMFSVSISMPASILLREHSMRLHVVEKFPAFFTDDKLEIPINRVWKMFVKNPLAKTLNKTFQSSDIGDFFINITTDYIDDIEELKALQVMQPKDFQIRTTQHRKYHGELFTRKGVLQILSKSSEKLFRMHSACPPTIPNNFLTCKAIECKHNSIFIAGRYCKYSRELSQSPWVVDGVKLMDTSVQEIMFDVISIMLSTPVDNLKFSSSGREDCDVRCLGKGRPFYIEILDPKKTQFSFEEFRRIENKVNKSELIKIRDLQMVARSDTNYIKQGEESKTKNYVALCVTKQKVTQEMLDKINDYGEVEIQQKTPIRVLHRRPLAVRPRMILSMKATLTENEHCFELEVVTQAGTYVKEFVHGDFGRTRPNINEIIGCDVDIAALDVISINLDWPAEIDYNRCIQL